jgi:hypothetical protein
MTTTTTPRTAVTIAYGLANALLIGALGFGVVVLVSMGVGIARGGESLLYGDTLPVPMQVSTEHLGPVPPALVMNSWADVTVEVRDPTVEQMLLQSARDIGPVVMVIGALWLIRGLLQSVVRNDPFGPRNVRRLRNLGTLLIVGGLLVELIDYSLRQALFDDVPPQPSVNLGIAGYTLPGGLLVGGLMAFVLAAVFAHGAELRDDVAGTI